MPCLWKEEKAIVAIIVNTTTILTAHQTRYLAVVRPPQYPQYGQPIQKMRGLIHMHIVLYENARHTYSAYT
jgi:hypothetical protein